MLNFAEQTGSGAVIVVWSFLLNLSILKYIKLYYLIFNLKAGQLLFYLQGSQLI